MSRMNTSYLNIDAKNTGHAKQQIQIQLHFQLTKNFFNWSQRFYNAYLTQLHITSNNY